VEQVSTRPKDIEGITVNRWAHGYAFARIRYSIPSGKREEKPWVIGRKPFGRIAIANSECRRKRLHGCGHRSGLARRHANFGAG